MIAAIILINWAVQSAITTYWAVQSRLSKKEPDDRGKA